MQAKSIARWLTGSVTLCLAGLLVEASLARSPGRSELGWAVSVLAKRDTSGPDRLLVLVLLFSEEGGPRRAEVSIADFVACEAVGATSVSSVLSGYDQRRFLLEVKPGCDAEWTVSTTVHAKDASRGEVDIKCIWSREHDQVTRVTLRCERVTRAGRFRITGVKPIPIEAPERVTPDLIRSSGTPAAIETSGLPVGWRLEVVDFLPTPDSVAAVEGAKGTVRIWLDLLIDEEGAVADIGPLPSGNEVDSATVRAWVNASRFRPATLGGKRVADWIRLRLTRLGPKRSGGGGSPPRVID